MGGIGSVIGALNPLKTPKSVTSSTLDPVAQEAEASALTTAKNINTQGYVPYTGEKVAKLSDNQNAAIASPQNSGVMKNFLTPAAGLATSAATPYTKTYDPASVGYDKVSTDAWNGGAAQTYMNPYVGSVLQPVLDQIRRTSALTQNDIGSRAAARNAFEGGGGKDRLEIANNRDTGTQVANSTNQVYSDAYNTGLNTFLQDQARKLQADTSNQNAGINTGEFNVNAGQSAFTENANVANQNSRNALDAAGTLGTLGNDQVALHQANLGDLLTTGAVQDTHRQEVDDANYKAFQDMIAQQPGGQKFLDNLLSIVTAGKGGQQLVDTSKDLGENKGSQAIGTAATIASLFA